LSCVWVGLVVSCVHNKTNMHLFDWLVKFFFNFFSMRKLLSVKDLRAGGARNSLVLIYLQRLSARQKEGE
jgi:hypothetical protein